MSAAYLLTWNPDRWEWYDLPDMVARLRGQGSVADRWSCGSRQILPGDRLYLIRLGREPRGLMASGVATSEVYTGPHWDEPRAGNRPAAYVDLRWDALLNPAEDRIFHRTRLRDRFPRMQWDTRMSGVRIPDDIAARLAVEWAQFLLDER